MTAGPVRLDWFQPAPADLFDHLHGESDEDETEE